MYDNDDRTLYDPLKLYICKIIVCVCFYLVLISFFFSCKTIIKVLYFVLPNRDLSCPYVKLGVKLKLLKSLVRRRYVNYIDVSFTTSVKVSLRDSIFNS